MSGQIMSSNHIQSVWPINIGHKNHWNSYLVSIYIFKVTMGVFRRVPRWMFSLLSTRWGNKRPYNCENSSYISSTPIAKFMAAISNPSEKLFTYYPRLRLLKGNRLRCCEYLLKYGFCTKLFLFEWTSEQLNTFSIKILLGT